MNRPRPRSALAALAASMAVAVGLGGPWIASAGAGNQPPVVASGWWSRQPLAQPEPDGGFELLWALEQEQSAAAIRIDLSTPLTGSVFLTLHEAGGSGADRARVVACLASAPWAPANPGPYEQLPSSRCVPTASVELGRDASAARWSADITPLVAEASGPTLDLVLHPLGKAAAEGVPATTPFEVHFSGASLLVDPAEPPPISVDPVVDPGPISSGGYTPPDSGTGFEVAGGGIVTPPPSLPPTDGLPKSPGELVALGPVDVTSADAAPWGRLLILLPLSAAAGLGGAWGRRRWSERAAGP